MAQLALSENVPTALQETKCTAACGTTQQETAGCVAVVVSKTLQKIVVYDQSTDERLLGPSWAGSMPTDSLRGGFLMSFVDRSIFWVAEAFCWV